jgi:hypothetical protein
VAWKTPKARKFRWVLEAPAVPEDKYRPTWFDLHTTDVASPE